MSDRKDNQPRSIGRVAVPYVAGAIVASVALVFTLLVLPGRAEEALRWYLAAAGAIGAIGAIRAMMACYPLETMSPWRRAADTPALIELPARMREIDRLVAYSASDARDFRVRLRPILHAIAAQRLATYRSIDVDKEPEAASAALGDQVWSLLSPEGGAWSQRDRGINVGDLRAVVEELEALDVVTRD